MELKITQIGNSLGIILPKDVLSQLKVGKGDSLWMSETPDGVSLSAYNPEFSAQMDVARSLMKKRRNVLHELAK